MDTVSAGIPDTEGFKRVLHELEDRSGELLATAYNAKFRSLLGTLERSISTRIENTELDDTELDRQERELVHKIGDAKREIAAASEKSRVEAQNAGSRWIMHIQQALESNINAFINTQMAGGDLQSQMGHVCRRAYIEGYNQYVLPVLKGFGSKLDGIVANTQIGTIGAFMAEQSNGVEAPTQDSNQNDGKLDMLLLTIPKLGPIIYAIVKTLRRFFAGFKGKAASRETKRNRLNREFAGRSSQGCFRNPRANKPDNQ